MKKIEDFGEKIGGAKKDLWAFFHELPEDQKNEMAKKDVLWKKLKTDDLSEDVAFWQGEMRRAVYPHPKMDADGYVRFVLDFKDDVENCKSMDDIRRFYETGILKYMTQTSPHCWKYTSSVYTEFLDGNKVLKYFGCPGSISAVRRAKERYLILEAMDLKVEPVTGGFKNSILGNGFRCTFRSTDDLTSLAGKPVYAALEKHSVIGCFASRKEAEKAIETAKASKRHRAKERFLPPHLSMIRRTGSDYRFFRMTDGNVLTARYGLRGGEFGNWATAKDRLGSLNMCYDAFEDLHRCLGISAKDISLGGKLGIAFGARGSGNAMAHYEPAKNVINLTRLRGAGSLAHEWGHAMDRYVGQYYGLHGYLSDNVRSGHVPGAAADLIRSFKQNPDGSTTRFFRDSRAFDKKYGKAGNGYWASTAELFARAFACYVRDRLDGRQSDYLVGHSECAYTDDLCAFPVGEERKNIDRKFDAFFQEMLAEHVFTAYRKETPRKTDDTAVFHFYQGEGGQMMFC